MKVNKGKAALALGLFIGGWHLLWSLLILLGFAQTLLNWIFNWHMLSNPYVVQPFSLTNALTLIVATFVIGYVAGYAFASVWNKVHKS